MQRVITLLNLKTLHCNKKMNKLPFLLILCTGLNVFSQSSKTPETPHNWQLMDWQQDGYPGISLEKAYNELVNYPAAS